MKMVIKYVWFNEQQVGCVAAKEEQGIISVGLSRCNRKLDCFSKKKGRELAIARATPRWTMLKLKPYLSSFCNMEMEEEFMKTINYVTERIKTPRKSPNV